MSNLLCDLVTGLRPPDFKPMNAFTLLKEVEVQPITIITNRELQINVNMKNNLLRCYCSIFYVLILKYKNIFISCLSC